jgi:Fe-S-cluster-containing hydrogenase component 2
VENLNMMRDIVTIDEELCDGCGLCVPACHEGALEIIDGKVRLVADRLCDGMGDCLGHCPRGAIKIERHEVAAYDEAAVAAHLQAKNTSPAASAAAGCPSTRLVAWGAGKSERSAGCPGTRLAQFDGNTGVFGTATATGRDTRPGQPSALTHWPVQLRLLPPTAPVLRGARLLVAADCVPVAYADFHAHMLRDHAVVIACPKLDDTRDYIEKLEVMIRESGLAEITVAHMEVPCCAGILHAVLEARRRAGSDIPINDVVVSTRGQIITQNRI